MKNMITLSSYYIFLIPIAVWFIVQGLKIFLFSLKHGWNIIENTKHLGHGHMPSAHTGFVSAMVASIGYYDGLGSGAFAVAIVMAIITIDDSIRLRMHIGDQGTYLNRLIEHLNLKRKDYPKLKERMGHKISEVVVGGILGISLTLLAAEILKNYDFVLF